MSQRVLIKAADFTEDDLTPYGYRTVRRMVENLYAQRLQADYDVEPMDRNKIVASVEFSEWLVSLIQARCLS
jgi:hypothetical protein